jgi:hypothetical protein
MICRTVEKLMPGKQGGEPMNTSSRVPGVSRNSGWQVIDAELAARRVNQHQDKTTSGSYEGNDKEPSFGLVRL